MPTYDFLCETCGFRGERVTTMATRHEQDCRCGARLTKLMSVPAAVHDDTIIGGFVQENFGVQPETFYSKRAMARRAKELGLEPFVRHVGTDGGDRSKHTSRWI